MAADKPCPLLQPSLRCVTFFVRAVEEYNVSENVSQPDRPPVTVLWNREPLNFAYETKLILDDQGCHIPRLI